MLTARAFTAALLTVLVSVPVAAAGGSAAGGATIARSQAAGAMNSYINKVRARHGLRPLRAAAALNGSARRYALTLMRQDALYHRSRPSASRRYSRAGEVLALHSGSRAQVSATVRQWMASPSHRAVLLTRSMSDLGAGLARGRFHGSRAVIWVVHVGHR